MGFVVWQSQIKAEDPIFQSSSSRVENEEAAIIDKISAADIAINVAYASNLPQAENVRDQADAYDDSVLVGSFDEVTINKPQIVSFAGVQSIRDIVEYVTQPGDTISSVAQKFNTTASSVRWSNNLSGDFVVAGKLLYIPPTGRNGIVYVVKAGDTAKALADTYGSSENAIITFNDIEISGLIAGTRIFIPDGEIKAVTYNSYSLYSFGSAVFGGNGYTPGQCTFGAARKRAEMGRPIPSNWGSAFTWDDAARAQGYRVDNSPEIGAIMQSDGWTSTRNFFYIYHVGVVVNVDAEFYYVYDMNYAGPWSERVHKFPLASAQYYNFIH